MTDRYPGALRPLHQGDRHPGSAAPARERPAGSRHPAAEGTVQATIYRHGRPVASLATLAEARRQSLGRADMMAWISLQQPAEVQLLAAAEEFGLHRLAVDDAIAAHQRPKLERYGETLFVVLRAAGYVDEAEAVEFGEIHLFVGPGFVLTVGHGSTPDVAAVRRRMEGDPQLLAHGPEAVLYAVLDSVVDGYAPVVAGLQNDIDEIETEVFRGDARVSRRIYELSREVIEFQRATHPLRDVLQALMAGFEKYGIDEELQQYLRDVADHATTVAERVDGFRQMLGDILAVNATLVSQAQNNEMKRLTEASYAQNEQTKRISAWAAILFAPTLIGTLYGMNFTHMPELRWTAGYPMALALMAIVCVALHRVFKSRQWL
jgi:magnesium transporter